MAALSAPSPFAKSNLLPTAVGGVSGVASLALALMGAYALSELAQGRLTSGAWLLVSTLAGRGLMSMMVEEFSATRSARSLRLSRRRVPSLLKRPRPMHEAQSDLAWALEQAAGADELTRLRANAGASMLGLVVIFVSGGAIAFGIAAALLLLAIPLYRRAGRRSEVLATEYQRRRAQLEERQLQVLRHSPELRGLGAVQYGAREIGAYSDREHQAALSAIRVALQSSLVTEFISGVSIGLVAMVVGFGLLGGRLSLAKALIAVFATSELFGAIRRYGVEFHRREDAARAAALLTVPPERTSADGSALALNAVVTFMNAPPLTLRVQPGDRVVISGPSGAGKTTLLETLLGWREALSGEVTRPAAGVGVIQPSTPVLSGTLRENLTLGSEIDDATVMILLGELGLRGERFADLARPLLPDGRGLSDGERVRILLARALLADASTLVIDDVAGLFDETTRELIRRALEVRPSLTVIEASVDRPLLTRPSLRVELAP
ncbi:MAG TPA: ATP-binding cassette domain-containing protein [Acidimicrobiales bacterium]|nr:ATP-binding cassette domain-containing protein [Acidimicrobiales bacterium]